MSFQPIIDAIVAFFSALSSLIQIVFQTIMQKLVDWFNQIYLWLENLLPEEAIEVFESLAGFWNDLEPVIGFVSYFVPVWTIFGIIALTYYAVASIRIVRWLLGIIPTLNLG